ncbi:hydroxymethylglutaryl-CoA reductase [Pelagicoccus enzymogenes]|uniref:hydroxymethylglutaryl-CoA reductase n=1 Tax=Pelagicoccus enzymogenes TaxID=2773457 RepID=UPI00280C8991|nr:hydroxymethylglutaryl-CoA reductase [Pelagicoccus enzymogenes]MDQ8200866.1 hydroxymethylglutaryl-CoA reductase [Pelagicoccus enzymogenes]
MGESSKRVAKSIEKLLAESDISHLQAKLSTKNHPCETSVKAGFSSRPSDVRRRQDLLSLPPSCTDALVPNYDLEKLGVFGNNIENLVGLAQIPIGIAGPIRVNGLHAQGDYIVPLATHEAALVASYHRGATAITAAGGCTAMLLNECVSRSPGFVFKNAIEAGSFLSWALPSMDTFVAVAEATTEYGKLVDFSVTVEGNHVYLRFDYTTGDAAGQNMVTIATQAICDYISENAPVSPEAIYVEANQSGDKKASSQSFQHVRGKKVTTEIVLSEKIISKHFGTTAESMFKYWGMSSMGGILSGTMGIQGHYANGLAALFIACGQDAACVAEAAVGTTRFELREDNALYATVTLPNLIVGTVGGGTDLPSQKACLEIMGLHGAGKAQAFAEVCAATVLAGELSIIAALASGNFARAHEVLARLRKR